MSNDVQRLHGILREGTCCAAALARMVLEARGERNEPLLQALAGLCGGVQGGLVCGALTGAACALNLVDPAGANREMVPELTAWFVEAMGTAYGGPDCRDILGEDPLNRARCPVVVEATWLQMKALLETYGHTLA